MGSFNGIDVRNGDMDRGREVLRLWYLLGSTGRLGTGGPYDESDESGSGTIHCDPDGGPVVVMVVVVGWWARDKRNPRGLDQG